MEPTITLPGGKKVPKKPVLILGGSAAVFILWRYWSASSAPAAVSEDTTSADVMDLTGATSDGGLGMAGGSTVGDPFPWSSLGIGYTDPTTANPTTNQQWFSKALEFASSVGYDPSAASEALGRYLAGSATAADTALITSALGYLGTPPTGDYGYPISTPVTSKPPAAGQPATSTPTTSTPTPAAPVTPAPSSTPVAVKAPANSATNWGWFKSLSVNNTIQNIAAKYTQSPGETITHAVQDLIALNPSLKGKGPATKVAPNTVLKVRAGAGTYVPAK